MLVLRSESNVSVHTYPEHNALYINSFRCRTLCDPRVIVDTFIQKLHPEKMLSQKHNEIYKNMK
ncbi:MAG: hypothetical protein CVU99_13220 [Firmicutes bacterium HGW-Firmicutes-4]|uniref:S-adenosylmethionine decarboxylase proenzyme n=1 Tax=Acetobacterium malicum TaxID=52692 RepID=A0ABR6YXD1_9FIRM|nr:hypothetical protein [Acetobacterium malicum]PKM55105.1 MAG: hypothetical protein CVU98_12675 [Firmicutes bacterium HGW-Firmicutes-3]PKM59472.1 MAG: hypothetical protein CVU99_13220 [Firmicutes bacterium HGW-Firmicutes-4]